jgi:serine/threonine protein kinase
MSCIRSPYIVYFYGACLEPRLCIVMEYCSRGSLWNVINDKSIEIDWQRVLQFSKDMTTGLKFLHTFDPPIFHRDMKSLNLLVTEDWVVKVNLNKGT